MANYNVKKLTTEYDVNYPYNPVPDAPETSEVMAIENLVVKVYQYSKRTADPNDVSRVWAVVENPAAVLGDITVYWSTSTSSQGMSGYYYRRGRTLVIINERMGTLAELPVTFGTEEQRNERFGELSWTENRNFQSYIMGQIYLK
jgi:hypothetical protein